MAMTKPVPITFEIRQEGEEMRKVVLAQRVIKVGCLSAAHLRLEADGVSRMHAYIEVHAADVFISDLGSAYGTTVNGQRINKAKLQDGDKIEFGGAEVTVKFEGEKNLHVDGPNDFETTTFRQPDSREDRPKTLQDLKRKLGLKKDKPRVDLDFHQETAAKVWDGAKTVAGKVRDTWRKRAEKKGEALWYPSRDGEGFLWDLLIEKGPLTLEEIEKHRNETEAQVGGEGYVKSCLKDMVADEAVIEEEGVFMVEPEILAEHLRRETEKANKPIYYCEKCLQIHGHLTKMLYVEAGDPDDEDAELEGYWCRRCQSGWKLNQGYARHYVSMQLQLYRALAKALGILEIEEEVPYEDFPYGSDLLLVKDVRCVYSGSLLEASEKEPLRVRTSMRGINCRDQTFYFEWEGGAIGVPLSELEKGGALRVIEEEDEEDDLV
jgi:pSer/pThr/pTyr-binding forkhead associated (FHA) protein